MRKALGLLVGTFVMGIALPIFAADNAPVLSMNVRFLNTDDGTKAENRNSLHVLEVTASQEVDNIGGLVTYRIGNQSNELTGAMAATEQSYPVEAKVWMKSGAHKVTVGDQFVPFAIYKWNNLYNPFLDVPGQLGRVWDADWGMLYTYDAKPIKLDLGYFSNSGEQFGSRTILNTDGSVLTHMEDLNGDTVNETNIIEKIRRESAEKNTITARLGYDILSNLNAGVSYMNGKIDDNDYYTYNATTGVSTLTCDGLAQTKQKQWALDATWGALSNLQFAGEYVDFDKSSSVERTDYNLGNFINNDGNYGLLQAKYDVVKVPAPLNKISFVLQYSWLKDTDNSDATSPFTMKIKNYQEEIWIKAGKNLDFFWQNAQQKYSTSDNAQIGTDKFNYFAVKYTFL